MSSLGSARFVIGQEALHYFETMSAQILRAAKIGPHEVIVLLAYLRNHIVMTGDDTLLNLFLREGVNGIAGRDLDSSQRCLAIETGWPVAAAEDSARKIRRRKIEHSPVFVEGASPGNDLL